MGAGLAMLLVALMLAPPASADPRPPALAGDATLHDFLDHAESNNPGLAAARERWQAALERIPQVKALPDPHFNYAYLVREVETRVGPQRQKFGLMQTLPWFGELGLKGDVAAQAAEAARQRYEGAKRKLFCEVKDAYYEYFYLYRALLVTEENLRLLENLEEVVRSRYRTGSASNSAVIRAQVERSKLADRLRSLEDRRGPAAARLNAALGRPAGVEIPWVREVADEAPRLDEEELLAHLDRTNPELLALGAETRKHHLAGDLAGKQGMPDFTLGIEYMETGEARMPGVEGSGEDPVAAMLSVKLPLWRGKFRAAQRESAARRRATEHARRDLASRYATQLKMAVYGYRDAQRKIDLYGGSLIPQGEQALAVTEEAFRAGKADFNSLVDAERVLLEFQLAYERAVADRAQRLAEIEMLAGTDNGRMER